MKEFMFTWNIENYSFCWHRKEKEFFSPEFVADTIEETRWSLDLRPEMDENDIGLYLHRVKDNGPDTFCVNFELSFIAADGSFLECRTYSEGEYLFEKDAGYGHDCFAKRNEVLIEERDDYLPEDTLTVQCRMWKGTGDVSKRAQGIARTRIGVERISFVERVEGFSGMLLNQKKNISIKSSKIRSVMTITVYIDNGSSSEEVVVVEIDPTQNSQIKFLSCQMFLLRTGDNTIECGQGEARFDKNQTQPMKLPLSISKKALMEQKNEYLPEDSLSLQCDIAFSTGIEVEKVEQITWGRPFIKPNTKGGSKCKTCANFHDVGSAFFDLRSLYNDELMSDIKLKACNETFPTHIAVLCARSPIFRDMFINDMNEEKSDCIEIPDLDVETLRRFLLFLYTDSLEDLQWGIAIKLYYAAHKYQVQRMKDNCSSFLMTNLDASNVIELLVLADMHEDAHLKTFAEDSILEIDEEVFGSDPWEKFMKSNRDLALKTMHLKYKRKV